MGLMPRSKKTGVTWIDHIAYDLDSEVITSFSLSFLDGPMASYETDLDLFKSRILKILRCPKKAGCKRTINIFINVMIIELRFIRTMVLHIQPLVQQLWYLVKNRRYSNKKTPPHLRGSFFKELHVRVIRTTAAFRRYPCNVLRWVFNITSLTVNTVCCVNLEAFRTIIIFHDFINTSRAVALCRLIPILVSSHSLELKGQ